MNRGIDPGAIKNVKNDESPASRPTVKIRLDRPIAILMRAEVFLQGLFDICPFIL
jgi:hypothetical protein